MGCAARSALALFLAILAGCSDAPTITDTYVATAYTPSEFGRGAARRDLRLEVRGDPFGEGAGFASAVAGMLNRGQPGPQPTTFTTTPDASVNPAYRVVLLFDAPRAVNSLSVCRAPPPPEPAPEGTLFVTMAFCRGSTTLSKVSGEVDGVGASEDEDFAALLAQMARLLFPRTGPDRD